MFQSQNHSPGRMRQKGSSEMCKNVCGKSEASGPDVPIAKGAMCCVAAFCLRRKTRFEKASTRKQKKMLQFFILRNPIPQEIDVQMFSFPFFMHFFLRLRRKTTKISFAFQMMMRIFFTPSMLNVLRDPRNKKFFLAAHEDIE